MRAALVLAGSLLLAAPARADDTKELDRQVQARFREGVTAAEAGRLEPARLAFSQAFALRPSPTIAYNLGRVELRQGRFVDAAQHFTDAITMPGATTDPAQREARKALAEALEKVGRVVLSASIDGAELFVDGQPVGRAPLRIDQLFVPPGAHAFKAAKEGYRDTQLTRAVDIGQQIEVKLTLDPLVAEHTEPPVPIATPPPPDRSTEHVESPRATSSTARPIAIGIGAGLTAMAAGLGTMYAIRYGSAKSDATALQAGSPSSCASAPSSRCADLAGAIDHQDTMAHGATASFVVAGALGAATIAAIALWPRSSLSVSPSAMNFRAEF